MAAVPAATQSGAPGGGRYAVLLFDLRRVPRSGTRITPAIEEMVVRRCVLLAIDALSASGAEFAVSGSDRHPVVQARFRGPDSPVAAVEAAVELLAAVRRAQRASENEFHLAGAIAVGLAEGDADPARPSGSAEVDARKLNQLAGPDQVVMSPAVRDACGDRFDAVPVRGPDDPEDEAPAAFVLRRSSREPRSMI